MGVESRDNRMFCNTADVPFGPEFESYEDCEAFITWVRETKQLDPRMITPYGLENSKAQWEEQRQGTHYVIKTDTFDRLHLDSEET